jgi:hypothetical protein
MNNPYRVVVILKQDEFRHYLGLLEQDGNSLSKYHAIAEKLCIFSQAIVFYLGELIAYSEDPAYLNAIAADFEQAIDLIQRRLPVAQPEVAQELGSEKVRECQEYINAMTDRKEKLREATAQPLPA